MTLQRSVPPYPRILSWSYSSRMVSARGATFFLLGVTLAFGCNNARALSDADGRLQRFAEVLATSQASHSLRHRFCMKLSEHPDRSEDCASLNGLIAALEERLATHPEQGPRCPEGKGTPEEQDRCNCEWAWVELRAAKAAPASWTDVVRTNKLAALPQAPPQAFIAQMDQSGSDQASKFWTLGCKPPSR